jgi:hypothetical protein
LIFFPKYQVHAFDMFVFFHCILWIFLFVIFLVGIFTDCDHGRSFMGFHRDCNSGSVMLCLLVQHSFIKQSGKLVSDAKGNRYSNSRTKFGTSSPSSSRANFAIRGRTEPETPRK